ncbi:MAG: 30S ribosomal protein S11 [Candidatus Coatesbacteria bacterium]|nr:MAG: 30S ribosomal protein S11 [Candidatus Coatesbacteria bacterium]
MAVRKKTTKKVKRSVNEGVVYISSTFNNTIITITDLDGNVIAWATGGSVGYKGSRKSTPYAASIAAENAIRKAVDMGLTTVEVHGIGPGPGRESAVRQIQASRLKIKGIRDRTKIPHNGCRQRKRRRV